eukprot:5577689-Pleurochrysis_carterae.AAC.1
MTPFPTKREEEGDACAGGCGGIDGDGLKDSGRQLEPNRRGCSSTKVDAAAWTSLFCQSPPPALYTLKPVDRRPLPLGPYLSSLGPFSNRFAPAFCGSCTRLPSRRATTSRAAAVAPAPSPQPSTRHARSPETSSRLVAPFRRLSNQLAMSP